MATHFYCQADSDPIGRRGFCPLKLMGARTQSASKQLEVLHKPAASAADGMHAIDRLAKSH